MKRIDIIKWKEFRLKDLFIIKNSVPYHKKDIESTNINDENTINYVTRTKFNNGILCKVLKKENYIINPANTISFGAENADFFLQTEEYITGNKMYYIDTSHITNNQALFIKTILQKTLKYKYGFSDGLTGNRLKKEIICLPIDENNNPDWEYMENFIKKIETKERNDLPIIINYLNNIKYHEIDTSKWLPFKIEDLFTIKRPNSRSIKKYNEGDIPFVSSGNYNNGVDGYKEPLNGESFDKGNCITVSPVDGSAFYQPTDFLGRGGGGSSIILLYNKNLNKQNGIFIATIIRQSLKIKYQYNDMGSSNNIKKELIFLPTLDENPDWHYMEKFIEDKYKIVYKMLNGVL